VRWCWLLRFKTVSLFFPFNQGFEHLWVAALARIRKNPVIGRDVEIRYHKRLHAKIYANETQCLITSMNLHDYSYRNNIEVGVLTTFKILDIIPDIASIFSDRIKLPLETQAQDFVDYIVTKGTLEYCKTPKKEKSFFGLKTTYGESEVLVEKKRTGFCIRTKSTIPFNLKRPYSEVSYESWLRYKKTSYQEKFCHGCGNNHSTSMDRPLCLECYKKN
jgi:hypothetical protein